jgi:hypothetical protein
MSLRVTTSMSEGKSVSIDYRNLYTNVPWASYSGVDYKFTFYVPVEFNARIRQVLIEEIQDEILELEVQLREATERREKERIGTLKDLINVIKARQDRIRLLSSSIHPIAMQDLQTVSYQVHVDKQPVRCLGAMYPKGYTHGPRLIAGSMICTIIREHPFIELIDAINGKILSLLGSEGHTIKPPGQPKGYHPGENPLDATVFRTTSLMPPNTYDLFGSSAITDELPPLHLNITGVNEAGNACTTTLFGVQFINDGMVMSIQNILTESTLNFVAQDIDIMRTMDTRGALNIPAMDRHVTVSGLLSSPMAAARRMRRGMPF